MKNAPKTEFLSEPLRRIVLPKDMRSGTGISNRFLRKNYEGLYAIKPMGWLGRIVNIFVFFVLFAILASKKRGKKRTSMTYLYYAIM